MSTCDREDSGQAWGSSKLGLSNVEEGFGDSIKQENRVEFIINLKAAKQIGLIIPPNVLATADKVIK